MDNKLINPLKDSFVMGNQILQWTTLLEKEYEMEFLLPFKAEPKPYKSGGYIMFIVNYEREDWLLELPVKTFSNAMLEVKKQQKKLFTESTNLFIKFKKLSERRMRILEIYPMQTTEEHTEKANHFYSINNQSFGDEE